MTSAWATASPAAFPGATAAQSTRLMRRRPGRFIGEVTVDVAAGVARDASGSGNIAAVQLSLGITYDDDGDGAISRNEVLAAITDYFADRITRDEVLGVITLYFAS